MVDANTASGFLLAEYKELKGEILKRSEIQHQLISIALVSLGALITVGLKDSPSALLAYPMLALFLSAAWSYNDIQIAQLGIYIRYRIEQRLIGHGLGWEHALKADPTSRNIGALAKLGPRGILWGSELLAVGLYLLKKLSLGWPAVHPEMRGEIVLLILSIGAIAATMMMMRNQDPLVREIEANIRKPVVPPAGGPAQ